MFFIIGLPQGAREVYIVTNNMHDLKYETVESNWWIIEDYYLHYLIYIWQ